MRNYLRRYVKIRFPESDALNAAISVESPPAKYDVISQKRRYLTVTFIEATAAAAVGGSSPGAEDRHLRAFETEYGADVLDDHRYDLEAIDLFEPENVLAPDEGGLSLDDVLATIRANDAWEHSGKGQGVVIAVVDTGIDGTRREFPEHKRAGSWQPQGHSPWTDWKGHGTMCACIAAGTRTAGGDFDGVAPNAGLIACKTFFYDSELAAIYDFLISQKEDGVPLIATNSFGTRSGTPPDAPSPDDDFPDALEEAIDGGIDVFFSAGNYHELAGGRPDEAAPNTVWLHKGRSDLMTVAASRLDGELWEYSSRGPGQYYEQQPGTNQKPDVMAPTPRNGRVVYGSNVRSLSRGWGTSGAAPQVAGLAALIRSNEPELPREQLFERIRESSDGTGNPWNMQGAGMINCARAVGAIDLT